MKTEIRLSSLLVSFMLFVQIPAGACTGVYVGRGVSSSGNVIIARSADARSFLRHLEITPAVKGMPGRVITDMCGFSWELPADTYKYVGVPNSDIADSGIYSSAVTNECGLAITATVTGYNSPAVKKADPNVPDGIAERTLPSILGACCRTAREAVELTADIIDRAGSAEQNIIMVADRNEAWYMEIYSGHQYCAVKMPEDCVAALGNEFMLATVDTDGDDVICSEGLFSLPESEGFAVYDSNGKMHLGRTYMGDGRYYDFSHMRTWRGHQLLSPSTIGDYDGQTFYPLFFAPDRKVSLSDVMSLFRDRYEGTQFCPDVNGRSDIRVIADETQGMVHAIEVYRDLPPQMACVTWLTLSEAAYAPFVPISNAISSCDGRYSHEITQFGYDPSSVTMLYKRLNALCAQNRRLYGTNVRKYWEAVEGNLIATFPEILHKASTSESWRNDLTSYCTGLQTEALDDALRIYDELVWYMMSNNYTFNYDCDFDLLVDHGPLKEAAFEPLCDVRRFSLMYGWSFVSSGPCVRISNDGVNVTLRPSDGHSTDNGEITVKSENSGSRKVDGRVDVRNGKVFVPYGTLVDIGMIKNLF